MRAHFLKAFFAVILIASAAAAEGIYLDIPYVRQPEEGCGAACLSMVLQYWSRHDPALRQDWPAATAIQRALFNPRARGIAASRMADYLRQAGFRVYIFRGDWNLLRTHLSQGRPLIVCLKEGRTLHYAVVAGIEPEAQAVLVDDPAAGKLLPVRRGVFEKKWRVENNWTLLALPPSSR